MSKDDHDRIRRETMDQGRIDKLNDLSDEQKRQQAKEEKMVPTDSASDVADKEDDKSTKLDDKTLTPRLPAAPPPSKSADSPKVTYEPMPDEIQFPGDSSEAPKAKPKATPRPSYKKHR